MASPELAIAKATLSATLFRADPTSLSRPSVESFFPLLAAAVAQCSRPNVQTCKAWILDNIAHSSARTTALAKFLVPLSKSFAQDDGERPSAKRRRLHVLYVVNDVLHHVVSRNRDGNFGMLWEVALPSLIATAASFDNCPKHKKKLEQLVNLWDEKRYFSPDLISQLREAFTTGIVATPTTTAQASTTSIKLAKVAPYVLPSTHGDSSTPWYDLPAATWLPHFTPNSTKPMVPELIRPLQLPGGPADKGLADAVRSLLVDVERLYSKERKWEDDPHVDLNELGERVVLDEITGEVIGGSTYYGWSRGFCEKMKARRRKKTMGNDAGRLDWRSRSVSRGRSPSSSPPGFKRRKFSPDSRSRSRSRSPDRRRNPSHKRSYSRSRSRSPPRHHHKSPNRSPPRHYQPPHHHQQQPPQHQHQQPQSQQQAFPPHPNFPLVPPPPPMGYQGPWPPPPPGPAGSWFPGMVPPQMMGVGRAAGMGGGMGGWGVPAPPPPPPAGPPQNGYGRGGYDRGGRGGW